MVFKGKECGYRRWYSSRICPEQDRNPPPATPLFKGVGQVTEIDPIGGAGVRFSRENEVEKQQRSSKMMVSDDLTVLGAKLI